MVAPPRRVAYSRIVCPKRQGSRILQICVACPNANEHVRSGRSSFARVGPRPRSRILVQARADSPRQGEAGQPLSSFFFRLVPLRLAFRCRPPS